MSSALCSVSMSEGEGDGELEGLAGRVTELRELLQGKEAVVEALHAEIDDLRVDASSPTSSHSQNSNRDTIPMYIAKVHTFLPSYLIFTFISFNNNHSLLPKVTFAI